MRKSVGHGTRDKDKGPGTKDWEPEAGGWRLGTWDMDKGLRTVFIFGNPDVLGDSAPIEILPELQKLFPSANFETKDPNEEWSVPEELTVIDTVAGIKDVKIFDGLDAFAAAPRITMHDFDAYANLRLLQKLGKLKKIKIIGIPPEMPAGEAIQKTAAALMRLCRPAENQ